ncbi:MAG: hypothetical protein ACRDKL_06615 [Solirubrobacteraceae bacterium]
MGVLQGHDEWSRMVGTTAASSVKGAFWPIEVWVNDAMVTIYVPCDRGCVIPVCSAMSYRGIPLQSPHCGARHACKGFTESVITELPAPSTRPCPPPPDPRPEMSEMLKG